MALIALSAAGCQPGAQPVSRTFSAKGVKIHYLSQGSGEPVVLIHGMFSSAEVNWQWPGTIAALAKNHRVIALDMPGHGRSDKPETEDAYGVQMVEDVILLLDHLKIDKAHIVGYSMGGMVAMKLITLHPDRVLSGTLGGMGWLQDGSGLQKFWEHMPASKNGSPPAACVNGIAKLAVTEADVKAIQVPMTVIIGEQDSVKDLYVTPLRRIRSDWSVLEIRGANHLDCIAKKEFIQAIVKWVNSNHSS